MGISLSTDNADATENGADLLYVTAELVDANNNIVRNKSVKVKYLCLGKGTFLTDRNGSPNDMETSELHK